ncbi:MAG: hypothetical protein RR482_00535 [Clostridia bacterium]
MKKPYEVFALYTARPTLLLPPLLTLLLGRMAQFLPARHAAWGALALVLCDAFLLAGWLPQVLAGLHRVQAPAFLHGTCKRFLCFVLVTVPCWGILQGAWMLVTPSGVQTRVLSHLLLACLLVLVSLVIFIVPLALSVTLSPRRAVSLARRVMTGHGMWLLALAGLELVAHSLLPGVFDALYAALHHLQPIDMPRLHVLAVLSWPLCALLDALAWGLAAQLFQETENRIC